MNLFNPFNYLPPQITVWIKPALYLIAVVVIFATGWTVNGWRYKAKIERAEQDRLETIAEAMKEAQDRSVELDQKYQKLQAKSDAKIKDLQYCIARGTCRLSIPSTSVRQATSAGVGNGAASRVDIDTATAQYLIGITGNCDYQINKLKYLQEHESK